jgi:hypothetical protein
VVADRGRDVVLAPADRQLLGVGDRGYAVAPSLDPLLCRGYLAGEVLEGAFAAREGRTAAS